MNENPNALLFTSHPTLSLLLSFRMSFNAIYARKLTLPQFRFGSFSSRRCGLTFSTAQKSFRFGYRSQLNQSRWFIWLSLLHDSCVLCSVGVVPPML